MSFKGYGPIIMIIAFLTVLVGAQSMFSSTPQPEMLQSQVGGTENSLQEVILFDLELELHDGTETEMMYLAQGDDTYVAEFRRENRDQDLSGQEALDQIRTVVESAPPLTSTESLTLIQGILDQLQIHQGDVKEFELEYELADGTERSIDLEVDNERDGDSSDG